MKTAVAVSLFGVAFAAQANPIRKIVTLLQNMQKEVEEEGEKEDNLFKKFMCYCNSNKDGIAKESEAAIAEADRLTAKVESETAEKKQLVEELKEAKSDRVAAKQDLEKATKMRAKEKEAFEKASGDEKANLDSTKAAIKALEAGMGGAAFLQTPVASQLAKAVGSASFTHGAMDNDDRETLAAFLEQTGDYSPQSGQIVGILKNMADEMDKDLGGIVADEEAAVQSFGGLKAAKEQEIAACSEAIEKKTARQGELAVSIVQAKNGVKDAQREAGDNATFLAELQKSCGTKEAEMKERVATRNEEFAAIGEAIGVLNDDDALETFSSAVPKNEAPAAFLQTRARLNSAVNRVRSLLETQSFTGATGVQARTILMQLKSGKVDFSKVTKMIDDMVALLKKEQEDDAKHLDYCETELATSADEKKTTEVEIESLNASVAEVSDSIETLKTEIATAQENIVALDKSVAEAGEQRKKEHEEYTETVQLDDAAIQLLFKAKQKLNQFYNPELYVKPKEREMTREEELAVAAGGEMPELATPATALVQKKTSLLRKPVAFLQEKSEEDSAAKPAPAPETWDGDYKKKGSKSNSILALMDMMAKDLEKDMTEAEHEEKTAVKDYEDLLGDAEKSRAGETETITTKEKSKADLGSSMGESKRTLTVKGDALATVEQYVAELHASCDFIVKQFEIRKETRSKEVQGLTNAKGVLAGANFS